MKNKIAFLLICTLALALFLSNCVSEKNIPKPKQELKDSTNKATYWEQRYFKNISPKDSVLFYNNVEIRLEGNVFSTTFMVEKGTVVVVDSTNTILKTVPKLTPGAWIDLKKSPSGEIQAMLISFSKNEATYKFSFFRRPDGKFTLNSKAKMLFNKKEYPVLASTDEECLLMFYFVKEEVKTEIKESAEGWSFPEK